MDWMDRLTQFVQEGLLRHFELHHQELQIIAIETFRQSEGTA